MLAERVVGGGRVAEHAARGASCWRSAGRGARCSRSALLAEHVVRGGGCSRIALLAEPAAAAPVGVLECLHKVFEEANPGPWVEAHVADLVAR